jgi:hypothetical protein
MQIILLLVWLFGTLVSMQAQTSVKTSLLENPRSITGKVIDKTSNEVLPYVNIILKKGDKFVTGGITSEKGVFQIKNLNLKIIMSKYNLRDTRPLQQRSYYPLKTRMSI